MPNTLQFLAGFGQALFGALLVALMVSGIYAWYERYGKWRARRPINGEEAARLARALPYVVPDKFFGEELGALLTFHEGLTKSWATYFAGDICNEPAAQEIREATGDLLGALHLPSLKRTYGTEELSSLIAALQCVRRLRAAQIGKSPDEDPACALLASGIEWLKIFRRYENSKR